MEQSVLPKNLSGLPLYFVGIKGTGMAALAELFHKLGARVSGSDTRDRFYTDDILRELGIPFHEGFEASQVPAGARLVIYSAAYRADTHPELLRAAELGLPLITYTEALGYYSGFMPSAGVAGVHGKTTTAAMAGTLVRELGLPGSVLAGSAVGNFDGRSTWSGGGEFFIAETCEYRRHFLSFHPRWTVLTSVEADHLDYFADYADILSAFVEYGRRIEKGGALIYCADDPGAREAAEAVGRGRRGDLRFFPYGRTADGPYRIVRTEPGSGSTVFRLEGIGRDFETRIPGFHSVLNASAAVALVRTIASDLGLGGRTRESEEEALVRGVASFRGSKRRSEILGEARGILFMDDYAHHPTALRTTLAGLREFHPDRRILADFMAHTYSRTSALLEDFASSFGSADLVILHKIYASARESNTMGISGRDLFEAVRRHHPRVEYFEEPADAAEYLRGELRDKDLFITLGANNN